MSQQNNSGLLQGGLSDSSRDSTMVYLILFIILIMPYNAPVRAWESDNSAVCNKTEVMAYYNEFLKCFEYSILYNLQGMQVLVEPRFYNELTEVPDKLVPDQYLNNQPLIPSDQALTTTEELMTTLEQTPLTTDTQEVSNARPSLYDYVDIDEPVLNEELRQQRLARSPVFINQKSFGQSPAQSFNQLTVGHSSVVDQQRHTLVSSSDYPIGDQSYGQSTDRSGQYHMPSLYYGSSPDFGRSNSDQHLDNFNRQLSPQSTNISPNIYPTPPRLDENHPIGTSYHPENYGFYLPPVKLRSLTPEPIMPAAMNQPTYDKRRYPTVVKPSLELNQDKEVSFHTNPQPDVSWSDRDEPRSNPIRPIIQPSLEGPLCTLNPKRTTFRSCPLNESFRKLLLASNQTCYNNNTKDNIMFYKIMSITLNRFKGFISSGGRVCIAAENEEILCDRRVDKAMGLGDHTQSVQRNNNMGAKSNPCNETEIQKLCSLIEKRKHSSCSSDTGMSMLFGSLMDLLKERCKALNLSSEKPGPVDGDGEHGSPVNTMLMPPRAACNEDAVSSTTSILALGLTILLLVVMSMVYTVACDCLRYRQRKDNTAEPNVAVNDTGF